MTDLTVLCVTAGADYALPFLEELADLAHDLDAHYVERFAPEAGYIERVLDQAISECDDGYIFRVDDDERCSHDLEVWLFERTYRQADHWAFPRMNLWPSAESYITTAPLWPDLQTRLSVKAKAGGRHMIHQGSPFGTGQVAPCALEHHKFLVRTLAERVTLLDRYEEQQPGAGKQFVPFSVPERMDNVELATRVPVAA